MKRKLRKVFGTVMVPYSKDELDEISLKKSIASWLRSEKKRKDFLDRL